MAEAAKSILFLKQRMNLKLFLIVFAFPEKHNNHIFYISVDLEKAFMRVNCLRTI